MTRASPTIRRRFLFSGAVMCAAAGLARGQCPPPDTAATWARVLRAWQSEAGLRWSNDSLRRQLLAAEREDQAARTHLGTRLGDTAYVRMLLRTDSSRGLWLDSVIRTVGLPTRSRVGARGADAALLIAQHNGWLLPRVLELAKKAGPGQTSPAMVAIMEDRVRVQRGEHQLYGSQFTLMPNGVYKFEPVDDVGHLAERRASAGLVPLVPDYVCNFEEAGMRIDRSSLPRIPR
jgi:hypothetical protein